MLRARLSARARATPLSLSLERCAHTREACMRDAAACVCASEKVAPHGSAPRPQVGPERASQRQVGPERASQRDHNYLRHIRQNQTGCPPERAASPHATGVGSKCCRPPLETPTPDHIRHDTRPVGPTMTGHSLPRQPPPRAIIRGSQPIAALGRRVDHFRHAGRWRLPTMSRHGGTWAHASVSKDPTYGRDSCFGMEITHVGS